MGQGVVKKILQREMRVSSFILLRHNAAARINLIGTRNASMWRASGARRVGSGGLASLIERDVSAICDVDLYLSNAQHPTSRSSQPESSVV